MMPNMGEWRLGLEVRREHRSVHPVTLRRSAVLVVFLIVICAAIEVGRTLVFVWTTMLSCRVSCRNLAEAWVDHPGTYVGIARNQLPHVA